MNLYAATSPRFLWSSSAVKLRSNSIVRFNLSRWTTHDSCECALPHGEKMTILGQQPLSDLRWAKIFSKSGEVVRSASRRYRSYVYSIICFHEVSVAFLLVFLVCFPVISSNMLLPIASVLAVFLSAASCQSTAIERCNALPDLLASSNLTSNTTIWSSTYIDKGSANVSTTYNAFPFCKVTAQQSYGANHTLNFQVWLPDTKTYQSRFVAVGQCFI